MSLLDTLLGTVAPIAISSGLGYWEGAQKRQQRDEEMQMERDRLRAQKELSIMPTLSSTDDPGVARQLGSMLFTDDVTKVTPFVTQAEARKAHNTFRELTAGVPASMLTPEAEQLLTAHVVPKGVVNPREYILKAMGTGRMNKLWEAGRNEDEIAGDLVRSGYPLPDVVGQVPKYGPEQIVAGARPTAGIVRMLAPSTQISTAYDRTTKQPMNIAQVRKTDPFAQVTGQQQYAVRSQTGMTPVMGVDLPGYERVPIGGKSVSMPTKEAAAYLKGEADKVVIIGADGNPVLFNGKPRTGTVQEALDFLSKDRASVAALRAAAAQLSLAQAQARTTDVERAADIRFRTLQLDHARELLTAGATAIEERYVDNYNQSLTALDKIREGWAAAISRRDAVANKNPMALMLSLTPPASMSADDKKLLGDSATAQAVSELTDINKQIAEFNDNYQRRLTFIDRLSKHPALKRMNLTETVGLSESEFLKGGPPISGRGETRRAGGAGSASASVRIPAATARTR